MPIQVRGTTYGNLYLTNQASGRFSEEDEELVTTLAATAGFAIDHARLFAETQRRQAWAVASAEVTAAFLSSEPGDPLGLLASRTLTLSDADLVCVVRRTDDPTRLIIETARGDGEETLEGTAFSAAGSVSESVIEGGQPRLVGVVDAAELPLTPARKAGPTMAIPLVEAGRTQGALVVSRASGRGHFAPVDVEMAADFAGRVSVALRLAKARDDQQRMLLLEDRGRIARDLHDNVIQQLFATGLDLQSVVGALAHRSPGRANKQVGRRSGYSDHADSSGDLRPFEPAQQRTPHRSASDHRRRQRIGARACAHTATRVHGAGRPCRHRRIGRRRRRRRS